MLQSHSITYKYTKAKPMCSRIGWICGSWTTKNSLVVNKNNLLIKIKHSMHPLPFKSALEVVCCFWQRKDILVPGACKRWEWTSKKDKDSKRVRGRKECRQLCYVVRVAADVVAVRKGRVNYGKSKGKQKKDKGEKARDLHAHPIYAFCGPSRTSWVVPHVLGSSEALPHVMVLSEAVPRTPGLSEPSRVPWGRLVPL
jgi:hypothetical protein